MGVRAECIWLQCLYWGYGRCQFEYQTRATTTGRRLLQARNQSMPTLTPEGGTGGIPRQRAGEGRSNLGLGTGYGRDEGDCSCTHPTDILHLVVLK